MKKKIVAISFVVTLMFVASAATAGPWGGRFYGMGPMVSTMTPEQSAKVLELQQTYQEKIAPLQEELWNKKMALRNLWSNPNADKTELETLQKEIFELIDQLHSLASTQRAEMMKILTPQ